MSFRPWPAIVCIPTVHPSCRRKASNGGRTSENKNSQWRLDFESADSTIVVSDADHGTWGRRVSVVSLSELFLHFRNRHTAATLYKQWVEAPIVIQRHVRGPPAGEAAQSKWPAKRRRVTQPMASRVTQPTGSRVTQPMASRSLLPPPPPPPPPASPPAPASTSGRRSPGPAESNASWSWLPPPPLPPKRPVVSHGEDSSENDKLRREAHDSDDLWRRRLWRRVFDSDSSFS